MESILSVIAVLGFGSIVAALIGHRSALGNHRQNWINGLHDDLGTFFKELEVMHQTIGEIMRDGGTTELDQKNMQEARVPILFVYWRIVLRLNRTEQMHIDLRQKLDNLDHTDVGGTTGDARRGRRFGASSP